MHIFKDRIQKGSLGDIEYITVIITRRRKLAVGLDADAKEKGQEEA